MFEKQYSHMKSRWYYSIIISALVLFACKKGGDNTPAPPPTPTSFSFGSLTVNGLYSGFVYYNVNAQPVIKISFSAPIDHGSTAGSITLADKSGVAAAFTTTFDNHDSAVLVKPSGTLQPITQYTVQVSTALQSQQKGSLQSAVTVTLVTAIDSTDKFPRVSDSVLLTTVQQQTFKYFWDFGHPVSGLARERNTSGETVTTGGSGFGIMTIPVAISRNFISRAEGLARVQKIVGFLKNTTPKFHGAFSHWMNGSTGAVVPFGTNDDGADLVETSYMMMGLLTARQFFNGAAVDETNLRADINTLWQNVEWDWFRQNGKKFCTGTGVQIQDLQ